MLFHFLKNFPKIRQKRKQEVIQHIRITSHGDRLFGELQTQEGVQDLDQLEQPVALLWRIHLQEQMGQAVDGIHVTIRRDPYHFCKRFYNGTGHQIDFVLGRFTDEDMKTMSERVSVAVDMIKSFCLAGMAITMNQFNKK